MKVQFILALIFCAVFSNAYTLTSVLSAGGSTCLAKEEGTIDDHGCDQVIGTIGEMTVPDTSSGSCASGTGTALYIDMPVTLTTAGFYIFGGYTAGGFGNGGAVAMLYSAAVNEADPCANAVVWLDDNTEIPMYFLTPGEYHLVGVSDTADICGAFVIEVALLEFTGGVVLVETEQLTAMAGSSCQYTGATKFVGELTYTPSADGDYYLSGFGIDADLNLVIPMASMVFVKADYDALNKSDIADICGAAISTNADYYSYALTSGTEYLFLVSGFSSPDFVECTAYVDVSEVTEAADVVCDGSYDMSGYLRPSVPATSVTEECTEGTTEYTYSSKVVEYTELTFGIFDILSCTPTAGGSGISDGALALYFGENGDAENPPLGCVDEFIMIGDAGDGGPVYTWFAPNEKYTIVATSYSASSESGHYYLPESSAPAVGCIPPNRFIASASIIFTGILAVILVVLF